MIGLCISGGGAKIGFAIGVLEVMGRKGIKPGLVYGISSGSLCTAALCYGDIPFLKDQMLQIKRKTDVIDPQWVKAIWTQLTGLGRADGLFGMKSMRQKLDLLPSAVSLTKGVVGYVDLQSGGIRYVSSLDVPKKEFLDAVQASCSIPFTMQTQRVGDEVRVDGGVRDVLPLKMIIDDPLRVDEIHVVCLSPIKETAAEKPIRNIISVSLRSVDILVNEVLLNDMKIADLYNRLLALSPPARAEFAAVLEGKRKIRLYKYVPARIICGTTDFESEKIQLGIDHGHEIAEDILKDYQS